MNILFIILFSSICYCYSYLNNIQLGYIKNIIKNPKSPPYIKLKVKNILITHYYKWIQQYVNEYKNKYFKSTNNYISNELEQYAIKGFLKSLNNYNGNGSLIPYSKKYIHGEICNAITQISFPFQRVNKIQYKKIGKYINNVSHDWNYNKIHYNNYLSDNESLSYYTLNNYDMFIKENLIFYYIKSSVLKLPKDEQELFFTRYDFFTLKKKNSIKNICKEFGFSEETYRKKMNLITKSIQKTIQ